MPKVINSHLFYLKERKFNPDVFGNEVFWIGLDIILYTLEDILLTHSFYLKSSVRLAHYKATLRQSYT